MRQLVQATPPFFSRPQLLIVPLDDHNHTVPFQQIPYEALARFNWSTPRILMRRQLSPGEMCVLQIRPCSEPPCFNPSLQITNQAIFNDTGVRCDLASGTMILGGLNLSIPRIELIEDRSDTWSHGVLRYPMVPVEEALWHSAAVAVHGPLMSSLVQRGHIGQSPMRAEWRLYAREAFVELRLRVTWNQRHQLLKLVLPTPEPAVYHVAGIPGGKINRSKNNQEIPIRDWILASGEQGATVGIVMPDAFAADVQSEVLRITLLRSCYLAHHDSPFEGSFDHAVFSDRGEHEFRFRFYAGHSSNAVTPEILETSASNLIRAPLCADLTRGMPAHRYRLGYK